MGERWQVGDKLRLFIAVRFQTEVADALAKLLHRLEGRLAPDANIKWVSPGNVHLTLQFLGDVDDGLLPKLAGSLTGAYTDLAPFEVDLAGIGAFPKPNRARVIWAGLRHGADGLKALHTATLAVTGDFGFEPEDRPFKAHVTLGRVRTRGGRKPDLAKPLSALAEVEIGKCQITEVHLVKSVLEPTGPTYTTLDSFPIGE